LGDTALAFVIPKSKTPEVSKNLRGLKFIAVVAGMPVPRQPRELKPGYSYHITVRCNNREFRLIRDECREVLLYAIKKCQEKYGFKLYALCIMSNHVHYLLEPAQPEDLPKIMHWLNWYTAMCFNRMLNRSGHFWEKRYHSTGFPATDKRRALNTLRYIHANPKAANMQQGFFYDYSNYGTYDRLTNDGITQWHPAFLALGITLALCAEAYRQFCKKYKPQPKPEKKNLWGSKLLAKLRARGKPTKTSRGQKSLWEDWDAPAEEIRQVAEKFVLANCFDPQFAGVRFEKLTEDASAGLDCGV
jgi:putative transposase